MSVVSINCPGTTVNVDINCSVVYGTDFYDDRLNHYHLETADGTDITYDVGPTKTHGVIVMKNVSPSDKGFLYDFILGEIVFSLRPFNVVAIAGIDLGVGVGVGLTNCLWDGGNTTKGVFTSLAPGIFTVNFPYKFTRGY